MRKRHIYFNAILIAFFIILISGCNEFENEIPLSDMNEVDFQKSASIDAIPDIFVTTTSDFADFGGGQQVSNLPGGDGLVSLREAIIAANNTSGSQVIGFNIPTSDPGFDGQAFVIKPEVQLNSLVDDGTIIDGTSQSDYSGDTNPSGPEIVINGKNAGSSHGIEIYESSNNVIRGLVINNFSEAGVQFIIENHTPENSCNNNEVDQCYIGTDKTGSLGFGNGWEGIALQGSNNIICDNLLSGNWMGISVDNGFNNCINNCKVGTDRTGTFVIKNDWGIQISGTKNLINNNLVSGNWIGIATGGNGHVIRECFVGTNYTGTNAIPNEGFGILAGGEGMTIENNLVSGNIDNGIVTDGSYSIIRGNKIGTDVTGKEPLPNGPNGGTGVSIAENSKNIQVIDNIIAFNLSAGVAVTQTATNNTISGNSIFSNKTLGIDLGIDYHGDGVTPNDPGDTDTGPNGFMNYPVLNSAIATPGVLLVIGTIDTPEPETVKIEFFANPIPEPGADPSGHGEGQVFLGFKYANAKGKFVAPLASVEVGTIITATATDKNGNTSEFSKNVIATEPPPDFVSK